MGGLSSNMPSVLMKKRTWTQRLTYTEGRQCADTQGEHYVKTESGVTYPQATKHHRLPGKPEGTRKGRKILPYRFQREHGPSLVSDFDSRTGRQYRSAVLSCPICCYNSPRKLMHPASPAV